MVYEWLAYSPAWLCWVVPIAGSLAILLFSKVGGRVRDYFAVCVSLATAVLALLMLPWLWGSLPTDLQVSWVRLPFPFTIQINAGVLIDPVSIILANVVAFISLLIMIYSVRYMKGDSGLTRYWFFMSLFIGSMLLIIMSDNFFQMLIGWEGVGLCSYALIGYWYQDSKEDWLKSWVGEGSSAYPPSHSGMKAFIMTRFGDVLMIAGIILMIIAVGTPNFLEIVKSVPTLTSSARALLLPAALLIFGGAIGKSAQLPLMEWLPDAMSGPTPVSALIHASTMVNAGVFLVARVFPIFYVAALIDPSLLGFFEVIAWIGAITAFVAATQATVSNELKKILAYSTASQIGYMMLAMGIAGTAAQFTLGYTGGIYQLMSQAIFKAALFLGAGAVIHAVNSRFTYHMGGLRKKMPLTFYGMLLASLSLMGFPLIFSGFWSKDMILESAFLYNQFPLLIIGLITVSFTSFYTVRMMGLVFYGKPSDHQSTSEHTQDPSRSMLLPFLTLSAFTVALGLIGYYLGNWLVSTFSQYSQVIIGLSGSVSGVNLGVMILIGALSFAFLLLGAVPAYLMYVKGRHQFGAKSKVLASVRKFFIERWYINALYYTIFVKPIMALSRWLSGVIEGRIFPAINRGAVRVFVSFTSTFRKTHTGDLNENLLALVIGLAIILLIIALVVIG
jgi:NADH-quinone oxidoreductase subunit L